MQLMVPGMGMPHPEDIALVGFQPGEGHALKCVHDFFFLLFAHLIIRVP